MKAIFATYRFISVCCCLHNPSSHRTVFGWRGNFNRSGILRWYELGLGLGSSEILAFVRVFNHPAVLITNTGLVFFFRRDPGLNPNLWFSCYRSKWYNLVSHRKLFSLFLFWWLLFRSSFSASKLIAQAEGGGSVQLLVPLVSFVLKQIPLQDTLHLYLLFGYI